MIGIPRVKEDFLLALIDVRQSSFGPILKDSTFLFKLSTIQSKNEDTYKIKQYMLFSKGDWMKQ